MRYLSTRQCTAALFLLLTSSSPVISCELECQIGITNAFVSNYSNPVFKALLSTENMITSQILSERVVDQESTSLNLLAPVYSDLLENAHAELRRAIFSVFHGKCQRPVYSDNGTFVGLQDPPGCPNPDCPVICGTPGSLVHFYSKLKFIAYNTFRRMLVARLSPGSEEYKQLEISLATRRNLEARRWSRFTPRKLPAVDGDSVHDGEKLRSILKKFPLVLEDFCGGSGTGKMNGILDCSWEHDMKEYISTFP